MFIDHFILVVQVGQWVQYKYVSVYMWTITFELNDFPVLNVFCDYRPDIQKDTKKNPFAKISSFR